jgi:GNAT superfamily N-acetyltransferase
MADVIIRPATVEDINGLTSLKALWAGLPEEPSLVVKHEYERNLAAWISARPDTLVITVAEQQHKLVGMGWLVLFERVPNLCEGVRMTGDIQSVFVLPSHRGQGIGRALVSALVAAADGMNIPRVTVSANEAATRLYLHAGFTPTESLLERRLHRATPPTQDR